MSTSSPPLDRPVPATEVPAPAAAGRRTVGRLLRSELGMIFKRRRNLVLVVVLPLFLPMAVSVVAGDSIAGEANLGTLRYLLVAPVRRGRLLAVKYTAVLAFCLVAVLVVATAGVITGAALFPIGRVTLLSGSTIALSEAMLRTLLVALYVGVSMAGLAAIGLLASTLTEVPVGAMAATLTLSIISQVLDSIPQVSAIHPYLFTHRWL